MFTFKKNRTMKCLALLLEINELSKYQFSVSQLIVILIALLRSHINFLFIPLYVFLCSHNLSLCPLTQVYPGLMVTAGLIHYVLNLLHITVHIRDVCVFLAPVFSGLTAISTFLLTRELWNQGAGLLAACFIAIVPGYISRSVAGSFDNEGIAIFALQFTYYLWVCTLVT